MFLWKRGLAEYERVCHESLVHRLLELEMKLDSQTHRSETQAAPRRKHRTYTVDPIRAAINYPCHY